jgi:hypothetical protein
VIVKPETVIAWHRRGFRLFWRGKSRRCMGRPTVPDDIRALISNDHALTYRSTRTRRFLVRLSSPAMEASWRSHKSAVSITDTNGARPNPESVTTYARPIIDRFTVGVLTKRPAIHESDGHRRSLTLKKTLLAFFNRTEGVVQELIITPWMPWIEFLAGTVRLRGQGRNSLAARSIRRGSRYLRERPPAVVVHLLPPL